MRLLKYSLMLVALLVQAVAAAESPDIGTLKGNTYKNSYFGLTMTIPSGWHPQDDATRMRMMAQGSRILAGDDEALRKKLESATLRTINLFAIFKHPLGTAVDFNHNVAGVAEYLPGSASSLTGKEYLQHTKRLLQNGRLPYSFPDNQYRRINIGGRTFYTMRSQLQIRGMLIYQDYYATVMKGHAIGLVTSYTNNKQRREVTSLIHRISFSGQ